MTLSCRRCHINIERRQILERELKIALQSIRELQIKLNEATRMLTLEADENRTLREAMNMDIPADHRVKH